MQNFVVFLISFVLGISIISTSYAETLDELLEDGKNSFNSQNYKEAQELFNKILELDENNRNALYYKGLILVQNNDLPLAMKQFEKILVSNSEDIKALEHKGHILLEWKRYDQAIIVYEKILEIEPGNKTAETNLWKAEGIKEQIHDPNPNNTEFVDFVPIIIFVLIAIVLPVISSIVRQRRKNTNY